MSVPARVTLATLGVRDVARSTAFYQALGWELSSASVESTSFFKTAGCILGIYGYESLAEDAQLQAEPHRPYNGVTLAINVESPEAVSASGTSGSAARGNRLRHSGSPAATISTSAGVRSAQSRSKNGIDCSALSAYSTPT